MEIAKYFERISKKRDLSNNSSDEEASKKLREGSLDNSAVSDVSANNDDPFTDGLKSPECVSILMNCMQNLEKRLVIFSKCSRRRRIAKLKANVN